MNNLEFQNQVNKLKQECELKIATETYKFSESLSFVRSQILGVNQEVQYCEKRLCVYESLKKDNMELSEDILATIEELKTRKNNLQSKKETLEQQFLREDEKYKKAYKAAAMRAQKRYDTEVKKLEKLAQIAKEEAENE